MSTIPEWFKDTILVLSEAAWDRLKIRWLIVCLDEAESRMTSDEWGCRAAVQKVREVLLAPVLDKVAWKESVVKVVMAGAKAAAVPTEAADTAFWAADTALKALERNAAEAGCSAARGPQTAVSAGVKEAWDRMTAALFDALEAEIRQAEQSK